MVHEYQRNRHEAKRQNNRVQFLVSDHRCGNVFSLSSRVLVCANTCRCRFTKSTSKPPAFYKSYNLQILQISRWCKYFKSFESGKLFYLYSVSYLLRIISYNSYSITLVTFQLVVHTVNHHRFNLVNDIALLKGQPSPISANCMVE